MRILFTYKKSLSTFMKADIEILSGIGDVSLYKFKEVRRIIDILAFVRQFWHLITHRYDVYYCFFNDYHSFLPLLFAKLWRKKGIVVVGGFDAMGISDKELPMRYGVFVSSRWRIWLVRMSYRLATNVLLVTGTFRQCLKDNGIKVTGKYKTVYFGWDSSQYKCEPKKNFVLLVGGYSDLNNYFRKGYDRAIRLARLMPSVTFVFIGGDEYIDGLPKNVVQMGVVRHEIVKEYMSMAQVVIQPSRAEWMPNTVAEAMLSGCYVVVSDVNGMRELVGEVRFAQHYWDFNLNRIAREINEILQYADYSDSNIKRVERMFPVRWRKAALIHIIKYE